jgi:hypothetical protein
MRTLVKLAVVFFLIQEPVFAGNYTITINNTKHDFSLGEERQLNIGGQTLSVKLEQKDTVEFIRQNYSFKHPSKYNPSTTEVEEGIIQTAMMTPLGTVVIVQEYLTLDPTSLIDLMVNEVTKEERQYGYKINSTPASVNLADGTVLKGKEVTSTYPGTDIKRYILAYGKRDSGILIMTQIDNNLASAEAQVIQTFFDTLAIQLN